MILFVFTMTSVCNAQLEPYVLNIKYDTKMYLLYYKTLATNTQANGICAKQGGDLVNIFGAEVHRQILKSMKSLVGKYYFEDENVVFNDTWSYWMSQNTPRLNSNTAYNTHHYSNWYTDVLGPTIGTNNYYYGCPNVLLGTDSGYWAIAPCNKKMPFVCELPKEDGKIETENATYSVYIQGYTREKAHALCTFTGGHLPYIESAEQNSLLTQTVQDFAFGTRCYGSSWNCPNGELYTHWIGVTNASTDYTKWSYDDGTDLVYTNWDNGNTPNGMFISYGGSCIMSNGNGKWQEIPCYSKRSFLCQYNTSPRQQPQVNFARIEQWANDNDWYNKTTSITYNQVNNTQYINVTNNLYNSTTIVNNNTTSEAFNHSVVINNSTNLYENTTINSFNITNTTNTMTTVYDRKMMMEHNKTEAIFWTLIGIGGFLVVVTCTVVCFCMSCWCYHHRPE